MKYGKIILIAALLLVPIISCKDKVTDTLPREAYSHNPEGVVMKSAPDVKSQMVSVIPFAEKITLTENSDKIKSSSTDKTKWYKTEWNGKTGWIQESSVGATDSVAEQIKTSFTEQKANFSADFIRSFDAAQLRVIDKYIYPAGEMEPARILFMSGGVMVLNSKIFTENYTNTFFHYEFINDGKLLKIKFVDSRLNFNQYADIENSSTSIFKIDKNDHTIIYHVKGNGFFFMNWGFHRE